MTRNAGGQPAPSDLLDTALRRSFLSALPEALVARVLEGGRELELAAGAQPGNPSVRRPTVALMLSGLVRVYAQSDEGRQVTVRYTRAGETLGLVHLFGGATPVIAQAVTRVTVWLLVPAKLRALARENGQLASAIAEECAARAADAIDELALTTFGSVRQRVARHLLDLAAGQVQGDELVAQVTQQQLANAVGTVREVAARVLKQLHQSKITKPHASGVLILDAARLDAEATAR
jgi:CRP/FNR family transcriptional regulator, cyclic AMP receptor protein